MKNKILYLMLSIILVLGIYGSQTSYEKSGYFQPYAIKKSNSIMTISIDNSIYKQGQTINVSGNVNHYSEGVPMVLQIIDPFGKMVYEFHAGINRFGVFTGFFTVPNTFLPGKYVLNAHYERDLKKTLLSIPFNISGISLESNILIPLGASSEFNNLNFSPVNDIVIQGTKIIFSNNDLTVHTIISGKISDNGTMLRDGYFGGGYISSGAKLIVDLKLGNYTYFCKLHPWLGGSISVKSTTVPAKPATVPAKPATVPAKPATVPDSVLQSIWKHRKDLQMLYPEAAKGNLAGLKMWASTSGWTQYYSLLPLAPKSIPSPPKTMVFDSKGIPLYFYGNLTGYQYNPLIISHWLSSGCSGFNETKNTTIHQCVKNNADWLVANSKQYGNYSLLEYHFPFRYDTTTPYLNPPWHSALAQGSALTSLRIAYKITHNSTYLDATMPILNSFYVDVKNGGITEKTDKNGWWYEQYAGKNGTNPRVLNGHMYAVLDLYNYYKSTGNKKAEYLFNQGLLALKNNISMYDNNGSSYYDSQKFPASSYYQKIHIDLASQFYNITGEPIFKKYHDKWQLYEKSHPDK